MLISTPILGYYIKYNKLDEILPSFKERYGKGFIFYIDLYSIYKMLYTRKYSNNDLEDLTNSIIKDTVNLMSHYKIYCKTRGLNAKIVLIYSDNYCKNNIKYYNNYNFINNIKFKNNPDVYQSIRDALNLISKFYKFLDEVYYFDLNYDTSVILNKFYEANPKMYQVILTKDLFLNQNVTDNMIILRPKYKSKDKQDLSYCITKDNYLKDLLGNYNIKTSENISSLIFTLIGCKQRDINRLLTTEEVKTLLDTYKNGDEEVVINPIQFITATLQRLDLINTFYSIDCKFQSKGIDIPIHNINRLYNPEFIENMQKVFNNGLNLGELI